MIEDWGNHPIVNVHLPSLTYRFAVAMLMQIIASLFMSFFLLNLVAGSPPLTGLATNAVGRS